MSEQKQKRAFPPCQARLAELKRANGEAGWLKFSIVTILFVAMLAWSGCKKRPSEQSSSESIQSVPASSEPVAQSVVEPVKVETKPAVETKISLSDVIKAAKTWRPSFTSWYGKEAPDFTLTDITGKEHKLSDYKGKNVLLIFWATWCPPCRKEIPDLIELRKTVGQDELAMLAISNEQTNLVKGFVDQAKINYTVMLDRGALPSPYNAINAIPSSFFIDPEGKIKLATSGLVSLQEIKAILQAEKL